MTYEFSCPVHGRFERFFKSFSEAEEHTETSSCPVCLKASVREWSVALGFGLYGEGFYKSSPTKRYSTKLVTKKGNKDAIG